MRPLQTIFDRVLGGVGIVGLLLLVGCATGERRTAGRASGDPATQVRSEQLADLAEDEATDVEQGGEAERLRAIEKPPARKRGASLPGGG